MIVEIWSDVMCPFCYIGKRKFEQALVLYPDKDKITIVWRSFRLNPALKTDASKTTSQYLAEIKGWTLVYAEKMNKHVSDIAAQVGLVYNLDKAIIANSFDAHRLSHLAKKYDIQDQIEEKLFAAYFTEGKNTADHDILKSIGVQCGLDALEIETMLTGNVYSDEVMADEHQATSFHITGVPYFVFDRKFAVSGAENPEIFLAALNKAATG